MKSQHESFDIGLSRTALLVFGPFLFGLPVNKLFDDLSVSVNDQRCASLSCNFPGPRTRRRKSPANSNRR